MNEYKKIEIVSFNKVWGKIFNDEVTQLENLLSDEILQVHHVGSTAIPHMPAKAVIDMMLECENLDEINNINLKLQKLFYSPVSRSFIPHRSFFSSRETNDIRFNLHIYERGDPQIKRHVNFRDYLIAHADVADNYATLKSKLATKCNHDINLYVSGKTAFIKQIDSLAKKWSLRAPNFLKPNTGPTANMWTEEKLVKAMLANLNIYLTHFAQYIEDIELIRIPGFTLVNSNIPNRTLNLVLDADFSDENAPQNIQKIVQRFYNDQMPFCWWTCPYEQPANLVNLLVEKKFEILKQYTPQTFNLDTWNGEIKKNKKLEIVRADDTRLLQDFAYTLSKEIPFIESYYKNIGQVLSEEDPIEFFVGYADGKPIIGGATCYYAQVAGLYPSLIEYNSNDRDYVIAMQEFRLKRAKNLGYHVAISHELKAEFNFSANITTIDNGVFKILANATPSSH